MSQFSCDGLNRVAKIVEKTGATVNSTRKFVWAGQEKVEFRDATDVVTQRNYSQGQYVGTTAYFYLRDHLGSIREMFTGGGTVVARYDYDPYGRSTTVLGTTPTDFNFTGLYRHSKSNLDLATYRAYDPDLGRWLSRDPIAEGGGLNLYRYVANNSTGSVDLLGLKPGDPYPTADAAGIQAIRDINPTSIKRNQEFGGRIYQNPDGTFSYTAPVPGNEENIRTGEVPEGKQDAGDYHTHGKPDPRYPSIEDFSDRDKHNNDYDETPGYLGTPSGLIKKYWPAPYPCARGSGAVEIIGTGAL
jgi:RHS repeat-associated protein